MSTGSYLCRQIKLYKSHSTKYATGKPTTTKYICMCMCSCQYGQQLPPSAIYTYIQIYILYTTNIYVCISKKNIAYCRNIAPHEQILGKSGRRASERVQSSPRQVVFIIRIAGYVFIVYSARTYVCIIHLYKSIYSCWCCFFFGFSVFANVTKKNIAQYFNYSIYL